MKEYAVYTTENFDKELNKLESVEKKRIQKIYSQLRLNPYVGDQLRYKFLREKRIKEKRVYWLVFDDLSAVLFVAIGGKKTQQETIEYIIKDFELYRTYLKEKLMEY